MYLTTYVFCSKAYFYYLKFKILMTEIFEKSTPEIADCNIYKGLKKHV